MCCLSWEMFINFKDFHFAASHGVDSLSLNLMHQIPNFSKGSYTNIKFNSHEGSSLRSTGSIRFDGLNNLHLFLSASPGSFPETKTDISLDKGNVCHCTHIFTKTRLASSVKKLSEFLLSGGHLLLCRGTSRGTLSRY